MELLIVSFGSSLLDWSRIDREARRDVLPNFEFDLDIAGTELGIYNSFQKAIRFLKLLEMKWLWLANKGLAPKNRGIATTR